MNQHENCIMNPYDNCALVIEALAREMARAERWQTVLDLWQAMLRVRCMQCAYEHDAATLDGLGQEQAR